MAKYKLTTNGYLDQEIGMYIPNNSGNRHYQEVQEWIALGNTPDPEFTQEEIIAQEKQNQIDIINKQFEETINLPADCIVSDKSYRMDGKYDSAMRFQAGIDLAELLNETTIYMVSYDNIVYNISIDDAKEIVKQQALYYRNAYMKRAQDRYLVLNQ